MLMPGSRARLIIFILLALTLRAEAFPELVRRGYANCTGCHISPNGGGLLTAYGRSLASEALTTTGTTEEGAFLYGGLSLPEWLQAGGDFRALVSHQDFNGASSIKIVAPMQADLEAAATTGKFTFDATAGVDYDINPLSRRHYVVYHPLDQLYLRGGKFMPAYGINTEDHALAIKRGVGKDQASESYNIEAAWIDENFDAFVTAIFGRPDAPSFGAESGVAVSTSLFFAERFKAGVSYYYGSRDITKRHLAGPFAILGISPRFFILAELDHQWFSATGVTDTQTGLVDNVRIDYEIIQGLHVYLTQEYSSLAPPVSRNSSQAYGLGVQFFPRPHLEVNTRYQKQRFGGSTASFGDFFWIMAHFYL